MRISNTMKRIGSSAAVVGVLTSGVALAVAAPASAETPGKISVCSKGNYGTSVEFPGRGGLSSVVVPAGECTELGHLGTGDQVEPIVVHGYAGNDGQGKVIGDGSFRPSKGGGVVTSGTLDDPQVLTPQV